MFKSISHRIRAMISTVIVAIMIAGGFASPADVAAQNQSVQSQLTGVNITYGPQYELQPDPTYEPNTLEFMMFLGPADILAVGFMSPLIDLSGARDIMLEGLFGEGVVSANIDRGSYSGVSYSLDMMNLDGSEMGVFTLFMNQRAHGFSEFYIFLAPPAYFGTAMQTAQNAFTIDGNPLMDGVDSTVMGDMVVANIGLTGGTAVTDVDEVTEQTGTTTTTTTTTPETTQPDTNARADYLEAVSAEYTLANTEWSTFLLTFQDFADELITAEEASPIITGNMEVLAGTSDRAAAIQPPAGMEDFHQEYLNWAGAMTDIGVAWFAFVDQTGTSAAHTQAMQDALPINESFGASLDAEMASETTSTDNSEETAVATEASGTSRTSRTTRSSDTTETPEATESGKTSRTSRTTRQSGSTGDTKANSSETSGSRTSNDGRAEYLEAVRAEYDLVDEQITIITDALIALGEDEITADEAFSLITEANGVLISSGSRIEDLDAPAGMEDFHDEFLAWSESAVDTGTLWAQFMSQTIEASDYTESLFDLIDFTDAFGKSLDAEESISSIDVKSIGAVGRFLRAA